MPRNRRNDAAGMAALVFEILLTEDDFQGMSISAISQSDANLGPSILYRVECAKAKAEMTVSRFMLEDCYPEDMTKRIPWELKRILARSAGPGTSRKT